MTVPLIGAPPPPKTHDSPMLERLERYCAAHPELVESDALMPSFLEEMSQDPNLTLLETTELALSQAQGAFLMYQMAWQSAMDEALARNTFTLNHGHVQGQIQALQMEILTAIEQLRRLTFTQPHNVRVRHVLAL